jgi:phosphate uptake regulator
LATSHSAQTFPSRTVMATIRGIISQQPSSAGKPAVYGVASAVDVALLGRFYERFADHAAEIGRRVIFQATGETPGA